MGIKEDTEQYRLCQAEELLLRFFEAHGRPAKDVAEMEAWVITAKPSWSDHPVRPRESIVRRHLTSD